MYNSVNVYLGLIVSQGPAVGLFLYMFEYSLVHVCVCMYAYVCIYMYVYVCMYLFI